jgi:outer membrane biosynthesis protein TonB
LINRIDTKELARKGQKDGAVMFCVVVGSNGQAESSWTYRGMPGTDALEEELKRRLVDAKFTPPIYNYQPVRVLLYGTAIVSTAGGTPSVRIFLNQDLREFGEMTDFISPQPVFGGESGFNGLRAPEPATSLPLTAVVDLRVKVGADGKLLEAQVLKEEPPLLGYGDAAMANFRNAKFIPAFRSGDPAESDTVLPVCYKPAD